MLRDRFEQANMLCRVRRAAFRIQGDCAESAVFAHERRHQDTAIILYDFIRDTDHVKFRRRVAHRPRVSDYPTSDSVANIDAASIKEIHMITASVYRHSLAEPVVDDEDNARI